MKIVHVACEYTEGKPETYKGFTLTKSKSKRAFKKFSSGDPVQDWSELVVYMMTSPPDHAVLSSSVDHFVMDHPKLQWDENSNIVYLKAKRSKKSRS